MGMDRHDHALLSRQLREIEEDDVEEIVPEYLGHCEYCGGPLAFMGRMGPLFYGRCTDCGLTLTVEAAE
jgi:hypothetical protein